MTAEDVSKLPRRIRNAGITQLEIARAIGIDQSQISRALSGKLKGRSTVLHSICKYVENAPRAIGAEDVRRNDELVQALADIWDGTPEHAAALTRVIRSLGALNPNKKVSRKTRK